MQWIDVPLTDYVAASLAVLSVSLGSGAGDSVGTNRVGGDNTEAELGEVSHGVGLVVYSVSVAG